jgi:BolA protein
MDINTVNDLISEVRRRLDRQFHPSILEIKDESAMHTGHAGAEGGMKHLAISISSTTLDSMPRILSHKAIYDSLGNLMQDHIHALRIRIIKGNTDTK